MVEDTSLVVESLNGLPGPLITWFLKALGVEGLWKLVEPLAVKTAIAKTCIGYIDTQAVIHFFEGEVHGQLVEPRGEHGFGWDTLFQPDGSTQTFGEMTMEEKHQFSMRNLAVQELKAFLDS